MAGGYRKGSGRSKSGYYKGIYCGSTYELCWVIYNIDHNISFERFQGKLEKDGIVYYPDFLLSDKKTIVETKGYESEVTVNKKTKVAEFFGYNVNVLRKKELQYAFEYVEKKYGTKKFYELYDDYKPKYSYSCHSCRKIFETDRKIKTETMFCSRICAGKYRKSLNVMTEETKQKISKSLIGKKPAPYKRSYKQIWITDGKKNTRIKSDVMIPIGFKKGRTI
jgi:GR25 family glycosyltransferase involved in LPS biosynthesis